MRCAWLAGAVLFAIPRLSAAQAPSDSATAPGSFAFAASAIGYLLPDDDDYASTMLYADRDRLHLEARYNYEDRRTASLWLGATWGGGVQFAWEVTPMAGIVFGRTDGAAPGLEATLGYGKFEWYVEAEYLVGFDSHEENFFYAWSELSFYLREDLRIGLVAQRTRAYESDLEVDRGPLVGAAFGPVTCAVYAFNLDRDDPFVALQAGVAW